MKKLLIFLALLPLFASAQIPAANDTTLLSPSNSFTPQFRFTNITLSGVNYRIPQAYNSLLGKYDTYITSKYLRAFYAPITGGSYVPLTRLVSTGVGLLGGGNLGSNLTLTVDTANITSKTYFNTRIGTAVQSALNLKAPIASPTFTGTANFGGDITATSLVLNGTNPVTQFGSRYVWQASTNGAGFPLNHFRLHDLIADSSRITVSNYGKVGINKADATEFLDVNGNVTSNGHYYAGTRARDGIAQYYSGEVINAHAHYAFLANDSVRYTTPALYGQAAFNDNRSYYGSEDSDHEHSFQSYIHKYGSGTSSRISSFFSQPDIQAGTTTHLAMVDLYNPSGAGAITNLYGIRIANLNRGANNWAIYSSGSAPSVFGGNVAVASLNSNGIVQGTSFNSVYSSGNDITGLFRATTTEVQVASTYGTTGTFQPLKFYTSDTERMSIAVDGTITAPKIQTSQIPSAGDDVVNKTAMDAAVAAATTRIVNSVTSATLTIPNLTSTADINYITYGTLCTLTLPTSAAIGARIYITGSGSGSGWRISQNSGDLIRKSGGSTSLGTSGYVASATNDDCILLVCVATSESGCQWATQSIQGSPSFN